MQHDTQLDVECAIVREQSIVQGTTVGDAAKIHASSLRLSAYDLVL